MENQHRAIKGYRELNEDEIAAMNNIKVTGEQLGILVQQVRAMPEVDQRWASIGATDLQTGLMALVRAIAKPTSFVFAFLLLTGCMTTHKEKGGTIIIPAQVEARSPVGTNQSGLRLQRCQKPEKEPVLFYTKGDFDPEKCVLLTKAEQDEWIPASSPGAAPQVVTGLAIGTGLGMSGGATAAAGATASASNTAINTIVKGGRH